MEALDYGITTAQKTTPGVATTAAILSYVGKGFQTIDKGRERTIYGWQGLRAYRYPGLGWRLLSNCDIPDLSLFPARYPDLKTIRFSAGLELPLIHLSLWMLSWLVRGGLIKKLEQYAPALLRLSSYFDRFGTGNSGFHLSLSGKDHRDAPKKITFELVAREGEGAYIPCIPAIVLAKKLANDTINERGAKPCIGLISKTEYLAALDDFDIRWFER